MHFKGWVPTVGKRLSFSFMGMSKHPSQSITKNVSDADHRYVISFQHRFLLDSSLPTERLKRTISRYLFKLEGDFYFVLVGRAKKSASNMNDPMEGDVLIFEEKEAWRQARTYIKKAQEIIWSFDPFQNSSLEALYQSRVSSLIDNAKSSALYVANFSLQRNGVCQVEPDERVGVNFRISERDQIRKTILEDADKHHDICAQAFFFIKDVCHAHQHHDKKTDTLVDLHRYDDEVEWFSYTLRALYKKVLDYKREQMTNVNFCSVGVLAYVDSFVEVAKDELAEADFKQLPLRSHGPLLQSIQSSESSRFERQNKSKDFWRFSPPLFFSAALFVLSLAGLAKLIAGAEIKTDEKWPIEILQFVLEKPGSTLLIVLLFVVVMSVASGHVDIRNTRFVMDIERTLQPLEYKLHALVLVAAGSVFGGLMLYIFVNAGIIASWVSGLFGQ